MASRKTSSKTPTDEISTNLATPKNQNNNDTNVEIQIENSINLNEFLEFLNLSCHVNDMISQNDDEFQRQHFEGSKNSGAAVATGGGSGAKNCGVYSPINFQNLAQNKLVNDLYGFNAKARLAAEEKRDGNASGDGVAVTQPNLLTSWKTRKSNCNEGLHVKLNEKLDYVLNEGILDAVLPLICPVPMPANYIARLKSKQRETKEPKQPTATPVATALPSESPQEPEVGPINKDSNTKLKSKSSVTNLQQTTTPANSSTSRPE